MISTIFAYLVWGLVLGMVALLLFAIGYWYRGRIVKSEFKLVKEPFYRRT